MCTPKQKAITITRVGGDRQGNRWILFSEPTHEEVVITRRDVDGYMIAQEWPTAFACLLNQTSHKGKEGPDGASVPMGRHWQSKRIKIAHSRATPPFKSRLAE